MVGLVLIPRQLVIYQHYNLFFCFKTDQLSDFSTNKVHALITDNQREIQRINGILVLHDVVAWQSGR